MDLIDYFTSPIFRAPTWGTLFMCVASSLMGVLVLLKKRSLLTETLSHATYPGVVLSVSLFAFFFPLNEEWLLFPIFLGAFATSFLALKVIEWLEGKMRLSADAALSFVLSLFFGVGIVVASGVQSTLPKAYQSIQMLLFGQAATMTDFQAGLYGSLALLISFFIFISFRSLQAILFDKSYATSLGIKVSFFERIVFWLLLFSLIIGMRSVGVVLMSGMAIAPAVAARQFSDRLQTVFCLAALFGALSGLIGNILSVELSIYYSSGDMRFSMPTGPMIVLVGTIFALLALAFAPKRGLVFRLARAARFRHRCLEENILKGLWKKGSLTLKGLRSMHQISFYALFYALLRLKREGWVRNINGARELTLDGTARARSIVRLHRLWELYLTQELGVKVGSVHQNAEEMEHILTPELEERLTLLLSDPKLDPHLQPIPERSHLL